MKTVRVLLVDDHAILRMGLASLLSSKADIEVVGDAPNGPAGIRKALRLKPDVVIMDLMMPGMDGIEATRELLAKAPGSRVLILTTFGTSDGISQAMDAGAMGAVMKNCDFYCDNRTSSVLKSNMRHGCLSILRLRRDLDLALC